MDRLEERIKQEYQNMKLPDTDMTERVRERIASGQNRTDISYISDHRAGVKRRTGRRIAAAAVIVLSVLCTSVSIYAAVKGLTIRQLFSLIWGEDNADDIDEKIACDAGIVSVNNTFKNIDIKPVKIVGDTRGLYVVLKVTARDVNEDGSKDICSFGDYELEFENGGSAAYELKLPEDIPETSEDDHSRYIAFEYIGGDDGEPVSESGSLKLVINDWYRYDSREKAEDSDTESGKLLEKGEYSAVISYSYISSNVILNMKKTLYRCDISSLTVMVNAGNEIAQTELIDREGIILTMADGSKVKAEAQYGLESEGEYTVVYVMERPVAPAEVVSCELSETAEEDAAVK